MDTNSDQRAQNQAGHNGMAAEAAPVLTKENSASIDVDDVWHYLGRFGRYQVISILWLALAMWPQSISILSGVFVGMSVKQRCHSDVALNLRISDFPNGSQIVLGECSVQVVDNSSTDLRVLYEEACFKFDYESDVPTSYVSEWDLVCGSETLSQLPQMLTMLGMMIGAMTLPHVGDKFGRRTLCIISQICHLAVSLGLAYAPAFELFLLLKFLSGSFNQGFMVAEFIMLMELLPTELRTSISLIATMLWVFSVLSIVPFAYVFIGYSWRTLQLAYGLISLSGIGLLAKERAFNRIAAIANGGILILHVSFKGMPSKHVKFMRTIGEQESHQPLEQISREASVREKDPRIETDPDAAKTKISIKDVFRSSTMRSITFINAYGWMVSSLTYYGITLLSTSLAGDPYINFLIGTLLEIPSTICMFVLLLRYGRRIVAMCFTGAAGVTLLGAVLLATLSEDTYSLSLLQTGLTLFGKFCISATFNIMWLYTPEQYPTNMRNVGIGISSTGARIAATASPFFSILARKVIWAPGALFSAACFLCVFLMSFLPETKFRELPSTIAEVEAWHKNDRQAKAKGNFNRIKQTTDEDNIIKHRSNKVV